MTPEKKEKHFEERNQEKGKKKKRLYSLFYKFCFKKSKFRSAPSLGVHTIHWFISNYENAVCPDYGMFPCQKQQFYALLGFVIYYLGNFPLLRQFPAEGMLLFLFK